jgi:hypothetical protein
MPLLLLQTMRQRRRHGQAVFQCHHAVLSETPISVLLQMSTTSPVQALVLQAHCQW